MHRLWLLFSPWGAVEPRRKEPLAIGLARVLPKGRVRRAPPKAKGKSGGKKGGKARRPVLERVGVQEKVTLRLKQLLLRKMENILKKRSMMRVLGLRRLMKMIGKRKSGLRRSRRLNL